MSATELDLPLSPSAEQIRRREFATIRRGYDPEQVRAYLGHVAAQVETLERQLAEARFAAESAQHQAIVVPAPREDPYDKLSQRLSELLRAADRQADAILDASRADAARTLADARAEADRIRVDAQARAEEARQEGHEFLENARIESERTLSGLTARRDALVAQLADMRARLVEATRDLHAAIEEGDGGTRPLSAFPDPPPLAGGADPWPSDAAAGFDDIGPIDLGFDDDAGSG